MRHVLDFYFLLLHSTADQRREAVAVFESLNMQKAAGGIMWIIRSAFGLDTDILCEANEKIGRFLMKEMMTSGNLGMKTRASSM